MSNQKKRRRKEPPPKRQHRKRYADEAASPHSKQAINKEARKKVYDRRVRVLLLSLLLSLSRLCAENAL